MTTRKSKGFTLIEVTLAIVIGIIMIAGATLIYNQAKTSAGNSRAQAKVVALQQLVEEFATLNQGIYPSLGTDVNALWKRKRPDDWNKSPWGGLIGPQYVNGPAANCGGATGCGVGNYINGGWINFPVFAYSHMAGNISAWTTAGSNNFVGGLVYDYDAANAAFTYAADIMTNTSVTVKGYAVYIVDQQGRWPNFVTGGKN